MVNYCFKLKINHNITYSFNKEIGILQFQQHYSNDRNDNNVKVAIANDVEIYELLILVRK